MPVRDREAEGSNPSPPTKNPNTIQASRLVLGKRRIRAVSQFPNAVR